MLKLRIKYFLSEEGMQYFPIWYEELAETTAKQDGFLGISLAKDKSNQPIIHLQFETSVKSNKWAESDTYNAYLSMIEIYFTQPQEAAIEETIDI